MNLFKAREIVARAIRMNSPILNLSFNDTARNYSIGRFKRRSFWKYYHNEKISNLFSLENFEWNNSPIFNYIGETFNSNIDGGILLSKPHKLNDSQKDTFDKKLSYLNTNGFISDPFNFEDHRFLNFEKQLSNSDISELLPEILKLKNLLVLNLSGNKLTEFSEKFVNLKNLMILDLSRNNLTEFNENFYALSNLRQLHLDNNKLTEFNNDFISLEKLELLNLLQNPLPFPIEILRDITKPQKILNFITD